jgi:serine phosphatase RsbU (regulator of sigma subunit)
VTVDDATARVSGQPYAADDPVVVTGDPAASRLAQLQAVTAGLAAAQTLAEVAEIAIGLGGAAVGAQGAMVAALSQDGRMLDVLASHGYDDEALERWSRFPIEAPMPGAEAARTMRTVYFGTGEERELRYPQLAPTRRWESLVAVPLTGHGRVVGVLGFSWEHAHALSSAGQQFVQTLALQCGQSLERARLYDASVETSRLLQRTLLPASLPAIPGLQIAARYQSVEDGAIVGGDFYDVFRRDNATWGVSIGDVSGKGVQAASLTALARHTIRASARRGAGPAQVLSELNDAVLGEETDDRYATVAHLVVRPESLVTHLTVALGGHPAPYLRSADRSVRQVGTAATAVGLLARVKYAEEQVSLATGNVLVLYTDGFTDARSPDGELAGDRLAKLLAGSDAADAETLADEILTDVLAFCGGRPRDDMALLVLRPE